MWLFLVQELMFFGGLFAAYTIYRHLYFPSFVAGSRHLDVDLGLFNTLVLIGSSLTMALGVHAAALGKSKPTAGWLLATILLGSLFLGVKVKEYKDKWDHHLIPGPHYSAHVLVEEAEGHGQVMNADIARHTELFFSLYFAMTGLHALHMIIGIPILAWVAWRASRGEFSSHYDSPVEITGLYWHFVDIVWIFLFPLLYLIGAH
jgi:cytochrome c oxidase subunit 3